MEYVIIWLFCGVIAGAIYKGKGRSQGAGFLAGLLLGPIGILLALVSSRDTAAIERQQLQSGDSRKCPYCAELVKREATVCKHCQRELPTTAQSAGRA